MKINLIFIETGVQKQHIWPFWTCDELKVAFLKVGNGVKVTEDLQEIYGWVTEEVLRFTDWSSEVSGKVTGDALRVLH
jgi:hypothetical protein